MIFINSVPYTPTIFPDGCQQVWNLPESLLTGRAEVTWNFENTSELFTIAQLAELININRLYIGYLPFGRQDKPIGNDACFGLHTFIRMLNTLRLPEDVRIIIKDPHSREVIEKNCIFRVDFDYSVYKKIPEKYGKTAIIFPDESAKEKYHRPYANFYKKEIEAGHMILLHLKKYRNPETGELEILEISDIDALLKFNPVSILLVDDICDGGATFIKAKEFIKNSAFAHGGFIGRFTNWGLRVTYGIFSKGHQPLLTAGFSSIIWDEPVPFKQKDKAL